MSILVVIMTIDNSAHNVNKRFGTHLNCVIFSQFFQLLFLVLLDVV